MSLVVLIGWTDVISAYYFVLSLKKNIVITCMINYFWWILMRWYIFICIVVIHYFIIDTSYWLCIGVFFKVISLFNEILVIKLMWGRFEFPITFSLFGVFELFVSPLLTCELIVTHLFFLDLYETFILCFILYDVNTMNIYFTFSE